MKLIIACVCLCMLGCGAAPDIQTEQEPTNKDIPSGSVGTIAQPHQVMGGCSDSHFTVIMIEGRLVVVPQPMNCNQGLNIYKGDPAPDKGDPWEYKLQMKEYHAQEKSNQK